MKKKIYLKGMSVEEIIRLLKEGKEIKYENTTVKTKMIEGVICDFEEDGECFTIGSSFVSLDIDKAYIEEEEKFEITETGLYKTRDGRKAFVYRIDKNDFFSVNYVIENAICTSATKHGLNISNNKESDFDIVAKWEE